MCFERISEQTATYALYVVKRLVFFITEVQRVYCAVCFESLYQTYFIYKELQWNIATFVCILIYSMITNIRNYVYLT